MYNHNVEGFHNLWDEYLYKAALQGKTEFVERCLSSGANVNYMSRFNKTPLFIACENNRINTVRILLENGANMNTPNKEGKKPFDIASEKHYHEIVDILLDKRHAIAFPPVGPFQQVMIDSTNPSETSSPMNDGT